MKNILIAIAATVAFSALSTAHAQDATPQVQVKAHTVLTAQQFNDFAQSYSLTNGQKITFSQSGQLFFVQVDNGQRVRIRAVSQNEFVSAAGTQIIFRNDGDEVGINNFENLPMAQMLPANTTVVAGR